MSQAGADEPYGSTLVLTLMTGQMVTLDTTRTRVGNHWLSEADGLEHLEWLLSVRNGHPDQPGCVVEVDDAGQPVRFFPAHAIAVARIDPYPLPE
jgi:hypothetical protein